MRQIRAAAVLVFLIAFALYVRTQAPAVVYIDTPEMVTAARVLGNTHSPGYPVYLQAVHAALLLPMGDAATRAGLLSAWAGALAAALVALAAGRAAGRPAGTAAAAAAGLAAALARTWWSSSTAAEVYCPMLAVLAGLMLCLTNARERRDGRWLAAAGLLFTLGLGVHQMLVFAVPALAVLGWFARPARRLGVGGLALGACALLAGASAQLYLPLRAAAGAAYAWEDPSNLERFYGLVTTRTYHDQRLVRSLGVLAETLGNALATVTGELGWAALALAVLGLAATAVRRPRRALFLALLWGVQILVVAMLFNISPEWYFFLPVFFLPAVLAQALAIGQAVALVLAGRRRPRLDALLLAMLAVAGLLRSFAANDAGRLRLEADWVADVLETAPPRAILVTLRDEPFLFEYARLVEQRRPDVTAFHGSTLFRGRSWIHRRLGRLDPELVLPELPAVDPERQPGSVAIALGALQAANPDRPVLATFRPPGWRGGGAPTRGLLWPLAGGQAGGERFWSRYRSRGLAALTGGPEPPRTWTAASYAAALVETEAAGPVPAAAAAAFRMRAGPGLPAGDSGEAGPSRSEAR